MGTLLLLDIPKVPSDSTIQELLKSVFGMLGMKNLTRLDSDHMCKYIQVIFKIWSKKPKWGPSLSSELDNVLLYVFFADNLAYAGQ